MPRLGRILAFGVAITLIGCHASQTDAEVAEKSAEHVVHVCRDPTITTTVLDSPGALQVTAARWRDRDYTPPQELGAVLLDAPITPELHWDDHSLFPWVTEDSVTVALRANLMLDPSPSIADIDTFLPSSTDKNPLVGYAAARRQSLTVLVTCSDGREATGVLATWVDSVLGVVSCSIVVDALEYPVAAEVKARFCH